MSSDPGKIAPFQWRILALNAALVMPPAFLNTLKTDSPVYFLITAAILLFAFFRRDYLPLRDRPIIYSVTAALILTIFPDMLIVIDDSRYGIFDLLIRSNLMIPLMTYLAALSCAFFPYYPRRGMTAAGVITALVLCGDRFNYSRLNNDLLSFLDPLLRNYPTVFAVAAGWIAVMIPLYFLYPGRLERSGRKFSLRTLFLVFFLILLPLSAVAVEKYYYSNDSLMRAVEYYILRTSMRRFGGRRRGNYRMSAGTDLNRSLPPAEQQKTVLMRIKSARPPGYLRSGTYDFYRSGRWMVRRDPPKPAALNAERRTGLVSYSTFLLPEKTPVEKDFLTLELFFAGLRSGGRLPAPGGTLELDAVADSGEVTENGLFTLKQWRPDGGCTLRIAGNGLNTAWQAPAAPEKELPYLIVSRDLQNELKQILRQTGSTAGGDSAVVQNLRRYFADYSYTQDNVNSDRETDPLLWFLKKSRRGHCEFFASAAVLLLRSAGIPARYVTGFIAEEKSTVGDYFLVRSCHAHAWCEAYLRDRKQWVLVDFTPEGVLESFRKDTEGETFGAWLDSLKQLFSQLFADIRRGHFAQGVMNILAGVWNLLWKLLRTIPGIIAVIAIFLLLVRRYYPVWKQSRRQQRQNLSAVRAELAGIFARFERRYGSLTGDRRPEAAALMEYYQNADAMELCRIYETLRYRKTEPTETEIRDFADRAARTLEGLRQKSASRSPRD